MFLFREIAFADCRAYAGDWNDGWDYGKANSDPWNIQGGKNGAQDICKFGDDKGILGGIFG